MSTFAQVVHVGDQLKGRKLQKTRAVEARTVMDHFAAFEDKRLLPPFSSEKPNLHECAEIIQKLRFISDQLHASSKTDQHAEERFSKAHAGIQKEFESIESRLLEEFRKGTHMHLHTRVCACTARVSLFLARLWRRPALADA